MEIDREESIVGALNARNMTIICILIVQTKHV
jgi:hypothetical protein